jgi:hypothetical protein
MLSDTETQRAAQNEHKWHLAKQQQSSRNTAIVPT